MKAIVNARVVVGRDVLCQKAVLFDKKIRKIVDMDKVPDIERIDANGAYLSAGFIDLHIHGSGGADVMDATPEALETICRVLPQTGTTAFLATTMTMSQEKIEAALSSIVSYGGCARGASLLGAHLEGPFINPTKHGAQDMRYVQSPDISWLTPYAETIRMITLAPEIEGGEAFVRSLRNRYPHMVLSLGHSDADYEASIKAFESGISHVTHLFNAMSAYHHREPGVVGACFDRNEITCDIIADTVHTHPHHLRLGFEMKKDRLILITDAMRAGCMRCGEYDLGGRLVRVEGVKATLEDGTLAGSVLKMNEALKNMCKHTSMSLPQAVYAVTEAPAEKLGLRKKGCLREGYDADMVLFDEDFSIITTFVAGKVAYRRSQ